MPLTTVHFYCDASGQAPVVQWLAALRKQDQAGYAKCAAVVRRLAEEGHALRRPTSGYLRDGVFELRVRRGRLNYRILYSFCGRQIAILTHALTKEDVVPAADIERAIQRKKLYEANPQKHTYKESIR